MFGSQGESSEEKQKSVLHRLTSQGRVQEGEEAQDIFDVSKLVEIDEKNLTAQGLMLFDLYFEDSTILRFQAETPQEKLLWVSCLKPFSSWRRGQHAFLSIPSEIGLGMLKCMAWINTNGKCF